MWFILLFLVALAALAYGLEWIIDQPGSLTLDWGGYHVDTSIPVAVGGLLLTVAALALLWSIISAVFGLPELLRERSAGRRREKGFKALSRGIVAVAAGDSSSARKAAREAEKHLPGEPLAQYLKAQAAQLDGERGKAEAAFHEMRREDARTPRRRIISRRPRTRLRRCLGLARPYWSTIRRRATGRRRAPP
jgi:HemY protein